MAVLLTFTCGVGSVKAGRPPGPNWPGAHSHLPPLPTGAQEAACSPLAWAAGFSPTGTYFFSENSYGMSITDLFLQHKGK